MYQELLSSDITALALNSSPVSNQVSGPALIYWYKYFCPGDFGQLRK
jgi:hypothetical protein